MTNEEEKKEVSYSLSVAPRKNDETQSFVNLYITIDGKTFELVPHCRTKRETAYFYRMLARCPMSCPPVAE